MRDNFKCIIIEEMDPIFESKETDLLNFGRKKQSKQIQQFHKIDENDEFNVECTPSVSQHVL